jgi:hypothetical protein
MGWGWKEGYSAEIRGVMGELRETFHRILPEAVCDYHPVLIIGLPHLRNLTGDEHQHAAWKLR